MNRTDRLVAMVMFLQGRRLVRAEELAEHFEISVRTVYRDVSALSEAGVPVTGEAGVGYSLVKGYHLPPVMFTADEALALFVGGEMVKQFTDASVAQPMQSALLKIRSVLPPDRQDDVDRLGRGLAVENMMRSPDGLDRNALLPIQQGMVSRRVLRLTYCARGRDEATQRDVEPLGVAHLGGFWYLVAWCRLRTDIRHFKLDRIQRFELLAERFAPRPDFSLRDHIKRSSEMDDTIEVRVWFSRLAVERARRETLHGVLREQPGRDGGIEIEMRTMSSDWLARWILSFGDDAEALAPAELREAVAKAARRALERHARKSS